MNHGPFYSLPLCDEFWVLHGLSVPQQIPCFMDFGVSRGQATPIPGVFGQAPPYCHGETL
jgi:hypothetical protein